MLFDMDYETQMTTTRLSDKRCRDILQARDDAMTALEIEENDK